MRYVIEKDDVSVIICTQVLSAVMEKKNKNADELLAQYTMAMAAFKRDDYATAITLFEKLPASVRENPEVKFMYCVARAKRLAENLWSGDSKYSIIADLENVIAQGDSDVAGAARNVLRQVRMLPG